MPVPVTYQRHQCWLESSFSGVKSGRQLPEPVLLPARSSHVKFRAMGSSSLFGWGGHRQIEATRENDQRRNMQQEHKFFPDKGFNQTSIFTYIRKVIKSSMYCNQHLTFFELVHSRKLSANCVQCIPAFSFYVWQFRNQVFEQNFTNFSRPFGAFMLSQMVLLKV